MRTILALILSLTISAAAEAETRRFRGTLYLSHLESDPPGAEEVIPESIAVNFTLKEQGRNLTLIDHIQRGQLRLRRISATVAQGEIKRVGTVGTATCTERVGVRIVRFRKAIGLFKSLSLVCDDGKQLLAIWEAPFRL